MSEVTLMQGDCLERMKGIPDGSVDLVLTDPPYGTVKGMMYKEMEQCGSTHEWDDCIDHGVMLDECNRVMRTNGAMCLFSQDPYTAKLMTDCHGNLPFSYRYTWLKDNYGHALLAKKAPLNYTEDVCVFFKKYDTLAQHPLLNYFWQADKRAKEMGIKWRDVLGNGMASHYFTKGIQFCIPTEKNYAKLQRTGLFDKPYAEIKQIDAEHKHATKRTFNLPPNKKYKSNVLEYSKDYGGHHPTQKPVALLEDLIKTYTNEGDTVLDFTMGSGSTGVACVNTSRNFIGIELDNDYFSIAESRIQETKERQP